MELWNSVPNKIERTRRPGKRPVEGRTDKKKKVSPWVSDHTAEFVHDVARYLTRTGTHCSDGDAARRLIVAAFQDLPTIAKLAPYLWRDYYRHPHTYCGQREHDDLDRLILPYEHRAHIRFNQDEWHAIDGLAFSLGTDIAPAAAALLILAIQDGRVTAIAAPGFKTRSSYSLREGCVQWPR